MRRADRERVRALLDGELSAVEARSLRAEAARDPELGAYLAETEALTSTLRGLDAPDPEPPPFRVPVQAPAPPRPRPVRVFLALGAAAATAAGLVLWLDAPRAGRPVEFRLAAADARTVEVAGDFNDWRRGALVLSDDDGDGVWTASVRLPRGHYGYMFVVDGRWTPDPGASLHEPDGFGQVNAVLDL
jgi:ferric-dicitrate binding protein FerR (iron transport regulator)